MSSIDERIVQMQFQNSQFEKGVKESIISLEKLKESLQLDKAAEGLAKLQSAGDSFSLAKISDGVDGLSDRFSAFGTFAARIIENLADSVYNKLGNALKSVTIGQVGGGWEKYAEDTTAVQTIWFATKDYDPAIKSIQDIEAELDKLMWFTDETSYNYTDMVSNIGKFTAMKIPLEDARVAMQGIALATSAAGQGAPQASRAMYNLAQAMGMGALKLQDWNSLVNANIVTAQLSEKFIEAGKALGTLNENGEVFISKNKSMVVTAENIRDTLSAGWITKDVMMKVFRDYGEFAEVVQDFQTQWAEDHNGEYLATSDAIEMLSGTTAQFAEDAFRAGQEAKTFKEAVDSLSDATTTKWLKVFKLIFGNYEEAKKLWTTLANNLYDVFVEPLNGLVELLGLWHDLEEEGGWKDFIQGVYDIMDGLKGLLISVRDAFTNLIPAPTLEDLKAFSVGVRDFGASFKAMFGGSDDAESIAEVSTEVQAVNEAVEDTTEAASEAAVEVQKLNDSLKVGDRGEEVKELQQSLADLGFDPGAIDGIYGKQTKAAYDRYIAANEKAAKATDEVADSADRLSKYTRQKPASLVNSEGIDEANEKLYELEENLQRGSRGEEVKKMQEMLIALGYDLDKYGADGIFGPETQAALKEFERDTGIAIDGVYDAAEARSLVEAFELGEVKRGFEELDESLKFGSRGEEVLTLQKRLAELGYDVGPLDGIFGPKTQAALEAFQKDFGLTVDGTYDAIEDHPAMKEALGIEDAKEEAIEAAEEIIEATKDAQDAAEKYSDDATRLQMIFGGVFAAGGIALKIVAAVGKGVGYVLGLMKPLADAVLTAAAAVGELLIRFNNWLGEEGRLSSFGETIKKFFAPLGKWAQSAADAFLTFFGLKKPVQEQGKEVMTFSKLWQKFTTGLKNTGIFKNIISAFNTIKGAFKNVKKTLTGAWGDAKGGFGQTIINVLTTIGKVLLVPVGVIGILINLVAKFVALIIGQVPKAVQLFKDLWSALTFEGDPSLGKAPGILAKVKNFFTDFTSFLFGKQAEDGKGKIGIFTRIGAFLTNDLTTFTSGMSEEAAEKAIEFANNVKEAYETVKEYLDKAFAAVEYFVTGDWEKATDKLSLESIKKITDVRNFFDSIGEALSILFTGKGNKNGILDKNTEDAILGFREGIVGVFNNIRDTFARIGETVYYFFSGKTFKDSLLSEDQIKSIDKFKENISNFIGLVKLLFTGDTDGKILLTQSEVNVITFRNNVLGYFETVKATFKSIGAAIGYLFGREDKEGLVSDEWKGRIDWFKGKVAEIFGHIKDAFSALWPKIKLLFTGDTENTTLDKDTVDRVIGIRDGVIGFFKSVGEAFGKIWAAAKYLVTGNSLEALEKLDFGTLKKLTDIRNGIKEFFSKIGETFGGLWEQLKDIFKNGVNLESIKKAIVAVWNALSSFFDDIWKGAKKIIKIGIIGFIVYKFLRAIGDITGMFRAIGDAVDSFKGEKKESIATSVLKFASAIGIIAASIFALGFIMKPEQLKQGVEAFQLILGAIAAFLLISAIFVKTGIAKDVKPMADMVRDIGISVGIMALAITLLGKYVDDDTFDKGFNKAVAILGALAGFIIVVGAFGKIFGSGTAGLEGKVWQLGVVVLAIGYVAKMLSDIPWSGKEADENGNGATAGLLRAMIAVFIMLGGLALVMRAAAKSAGEIKIKGLISLSVALLVMSHIVKSLGKMDPGEFEQGMIGLSVMLAGVWLIVKAFGKHSADLNTGQILAMMLGIGAVIGVFGYIINLIKNVNPTVMVAFSGSLALALVAFVGACAMIGKMTPSGGGLKDNTMFKGALAIAASLAVFAGAALIIVAAAGALNTILVGEDKTSILESGKQALITTGQAVQGFIDSLGGPVSVLNYLIAGAAIGELEKWTDSSGRTLGGCATIVGALSIFLIASLIIVGAAGAISDVIGEQGEESVFDKGADALQKTADGIKGFMDTLGIHWEGLAAALAVSWAIGVTDTGLAVIAGAAEAAVAIGAFLTTLGLFVGANGMIDEITGGRYVAMVERGGDVLEALGTALGRFIGGFTGVFIDQINEFTTALSDFRTAVGGLSTDEQFQADKEAALGVAQDLHDFFADLSSYKPDTGWGAEFQETAASILSDDVSAFGQGIQDLRAGITKISEETTIDDDVTKSTQVALDLHAFFTTLQTKMPQGTELQDYNAAIGNLMDDVGVFGDTMGTFRDNIEGVGSPLTEYDIEVAITTAQSVADFCQDLSNMTIPTHARGFLKLFQNKTEDETVLDTIGDLADSMVRNAPKFEGLGSSTIVQDVTAATGALKSVAKFLTVLSSDAITVAASDSQGYDVTTGKLRDLLTNLNELSAKIREFSDQTQDIDLGSIAYVIQSITNFLSLLATEGDFSSDDFLKGLNGEVISSKFTELVSSINTALTETDTQLTDIGASLTANILSGLTGADISSASDLVTSITNLLDKYYKDFLTAGENFALGLTRGVYLKGVLAVEAARYTAKQMVAAIKNVFQYASPSKVTTQAGEYFSQGLSRGVEKDGDQAVQSAEDVAKAMLTTAGGTLTNLSDLLAQDIDAEPTISPIVDLTQAREAAGSISSLFGDQSTGVTMTRTLVNRATTDADGNPIRQRGAENTESIKMMKDYLDGISRDMDGFRTTNLVDEVQAISDKFGDLAEAVTNMKLVLDTGAIVGETYSLYDRQFGVAAAMRERGN